MSYKAWIVAVLVTAGMPAAAAEKKCVLQITGELPVTMNGTQPLIEGTINGKPARFLADSGAFFSMLSLQNTQKFGVKLEPAPANLQIVSGVVGNARVQMTKVAQFTLTGFAGGHVYEKVDFLVIDKILGGGRVDGLIGQNVIGMGDTEYDLANGFIRLLRSKDCKDAMLAYWAAGKAVAALDYEPTSILEPHLVTTARLNGKKIRVMLDSGASRSFLTLRAAARAGIEPEDEGVTAAGITRGIGRRTPESFLASFDSLDLGGEVIRNARLRMSDAGGDSIDMLLGADFFLSHRLYVDSRNRKIYFTYNGGPVFDLRRRNDDADVQAAADPLAPPDASAAGPTAGNA
ncbi:MAG TPA: aspartyl protease family protein, partial [Povalibacter sp.]|nr:aspartyl protease family protein [Povalibacter sp.]